MYMRAYVRAISGKGCDCLEIRHPSSEFELGHGRRLEETVVPRTRHVLRSIWNFRSCVSRIDAIEVVYTVLCLRGA